jgi:hypothetical protein
MTVPDDQVPETPSGSPENVAPVAPMDVYEISVMGELTHTF